MPAWVLGSKFGWRNLEGVGLSSRYCVPMELTSDYIHVVCFFMEMASNFLFAIQMQLNGVRLSCIACCSADIELEIHLPMWAFDRDVRLIEYIPAPTFP